MTWFAMLKSRLNNRYTLKFMAMSLNDSVNRQPSIHLQNATELRKAWIKCLTQ